MLKSQQNQLCKQYMIVAIYVNNKIMTPSGPAAAPNILNIKLTKLPCYKIVFNDNSEIILPEKTKIKTTNEDLEVGKKYSRSHFYRNPIYINKFEFNQKCVDPYLIGLLIRCKIKNNTFICKKRIKDFQCSYYHVEQRASKITAAPNYPNILFGDTKKLKLNCKLSLRSIPEEYLFSSIEDRKKLLNGLLEIIGDGSENTFCTPSPVLAKDFAMLIRSLGGFARITKLHTKTPFFKIKFFEKNSAFDKPDKVIESITTIGEQPCFSIDIDNLIINDFIEIS